MKVKIINGPNLNLLGIREPHIYGNQSFEDYFETLKKKYQNLELLYFQSNHEGEIIDELHKSIKDKTDGIIINAGAYTHYSYAIRDAIKAIMISCVEVHISNIHQREKFRSKSVISEVCQGTISGFGLMSYQLALDFFVYKL